MAGFRKCHLCGRQIDTDYEPHGRQARLDFSGRPEIDGKTKRIKYDVFCVPSCPMPPPGRGAPTTATTT